MDRGVGRKALERSAGTKVTATSVVAHSAFARTTASHYGPFAASSSR